VVCFCVFHQSFYIHMSYVAIPSSLKDVDSIYLELMSPEEMENMSFGEVLTSETINYRTGAPQMNGLFCQAIFGPVKDWECACGKYKRYRYAGVICDKCGVEVAHSSVRRERMGHISLAAPCTHPWFLRLIPSRIALALDMKAADVNRVTYFSAYVITEINEDLREEYVDKINTEAAAREKKSKSEFDKKFEDLSRQFQIDKSSGQFDDEALRTSYERDKEILKAQQAEMLARIETIAEMAKKEIINLHFKDVITEVQYQELAKKFGAVFKAGIGAEAVEELLKKINLEQEHEQLKNEMVAARGQKKKKIAKRYKLIKNFLKTDTKPEWMILRRVMVLPPELRPMLQLDGGRFAASDLNELYRRLINRNNRLRKLIQIGAPEVILRNEKRMLQEAVEALIDNSSRGGRQVMASTGIKRPLKSLTDVLKGKQGRFRQNLLGKRVDYSGRSVIIIGPSLKLDECGLPKEMALELFKPFMIGKFIEKSEKGLLGEDLQVFNVHSARRLIDSRVPAVYDILDEVIRDKYVLLNRAPTLHRLSFLAFKPVLIEGKAIQLHPLVCPGFNADFDGDQMAVHLPITVKGQEEAKELMVASRNLVKPASGDLIAAGHQDIVLGAYYLTIITKENTLEKTQAFGSQESALNAFYNHAIALGEKIKVKLQSGKDGKIVDTTAGRIIFNNCFPERIEFINEAINKKAYEKLMNRMYFTVGADEMPAILDAIKSTSFQYVTHAGITLSAYDVESPAGKQEILTEASKQVNKIEELSAYGLLSVKDRHNQIIDTWTVAQDNIKQLVADNVDPTGNIGVMLQSGARGNISQLNQMAGIRGLSVTATGETLELPARRGYVEGLTGLEYFLTMKGARKALADIALRTADAGYLTRRLVDVAQSIIVMAEDCGTTKGIVMNLENSAQMQKDLYERVYGRYLVEDAVAPTGEVIAQAGSYVDYDTKKRLAAAKVAQITVRSTSKCELPKGVCQHCYGLDFSTHMPIKLGTTAGIVAAQSLGEPSTQLTMRSKHTGGILKKSDITTGLPRVEELFENRIPKSVVPLAEFTGRVEKVEGDVDQGYTVHVITTENHIALPHSGNDTQLLVKEGKSVKPGEAIAVAATGEIILADQPGELVIQDGKPMVQATQAYAEAYSIQPGFTISVKPGDVVERGQNLAEGPADLQTILDLRGFDGLQEYIVQQLNDVYTSNGIIVNEKHVETIIRVMMGKVQVIDAGESDLTPGDVVNYSMVQLLNQKLASEDQSIVSFKRVVAGISRASLSTDSFLSAASFQETARVLVEAVLSGRRDNLLGLKENVILGQLIPAGTGFKHKDISADMDGDFEEDSHEE